MTGNPSLIWQGKVCRHNRELIGPLFLDAIDEKQKLRAFRFVGLKTNHNDQLDGQRYEAAWMLYSSEY
jgi:hypothetical protein